MNQSAGGTHLPASKLKWLIFTIPQWLLKAKILQETKTKSKLLPGDILKLCILP